MFYKILHYFHKLYILQANEGIIITQNEQLLDILFINS